MKIKTQESHAPRALVLAAFATVYIVWGSTYLAIRVAVETLPPFFMAACRFIIAGTLLILWLRLRGTPFPERSHWLNATISGSLLLVGGNGLVVFAEQTVPSGLASLLVAFAPVWFALIDWLRPRGTRPKNRTVIGILVGFAGMVLLVMHGTPQDHGPSLNPWGVLALFVAGISWAAGSLYSKHTSKVDSPWMTAAMQMLSSGVVLMLLAVLAGEFAHLDLGSVSIRSLSSVLYLIVFGSWIGFSAYTWLLKVSKPANVATYAYVNPIIALFLGNVLLGEIITPRMLFAATVIITGVVIITLPKGALGARRLPKRFLRGTRRVA